MARNHPVDLQRTGDGEHFVPNADTAARLLPTGALALVVVPLRAVVYELVSSLVMPF